MVRGNEYCKHSWLEPLAGMCLSSMYLVGLLRGRPIFHMVQSVFSIQVGAGGINCCYCFALCVVCRWPGWQNVAARAFTHASHWRQGLLAPCAGHQRACWNRGIQVSASADGPHCCCTCSCISVVAAALPSYDVGVRVHGLQLEFQFCLWPLAVYPCNECSQGLAPSNTAVYL